MPSLSVVCRLLQVLLAASVIITFIRITTFQCYKDTVPAYVRLGKDYTHAPKAADYTIHRALLSNANGSAKMKDIMEHQYKSMEDFCQTQKLSRTVYDVTTMQDLYHHLLVDDKHKIIFCFIPKVSCSNWKRVFLILDGKIDPTVARRPQVEIFRQITSLHKFNPKEQEYRLRHYFKFMFVRDPSERVLSAYRNKIENQRYVSASEQEVWQRIHEAVDSYRNINNSASQHTELDHPTFGEFLHFLYDSDPRPMNEHFKPMVELCQPCAVKYDFVGNFAMLRQDADTILDHLQINKTFFGEYGKHINQTQTLMKEYFSKLKPIDFERMEKRYGNDMSFYHSLFPISLEGDDEYTIVKESILKAEQH